MAKRAPLFQQQGGVGVNAQAQGRDEVLVPRSERVDQLRHPGLPVAQAQQVVVQAVVEFLDQPLHVFRRRLAGQGRRDAGEQGGGGRDGLRRLAAAEPGERPIDLAIVDAAELQAFEAQHGLLGPEREPGHRAFDDQVLAEEEMFAEQGLQHALQAATAGLRQRRVGVGVSMCNGNRFQECVHGLPSRISHL